MSYSVSIILLYFVLTWIFCIEDVIHVSFYLWVLSLCPQQWVYTMNVWGNSTICWATTTMPESSSSSSSSPIILLILFHICLDTHFCLWKELIMFYYNWVLSWGVSEALRTAENDDDDTSDYLHPACQEEAWWPAAAAASSSCGPTCRTAPPHAVLYYYYYITSLISLFFTFSLSQMQRFSR